MSNSKTFVSSDGAKHTRFSSDDEDDNKQKDKPEKKVEKIEVHSANSWEKADLGDGDRNNKFLRLMGAAKKKHQGRFVIGDNSPHSQRPETSDKLNDKLEEQYQHSMEHRLMAGRKGHIGLGFHDESADKKDEKEVPEAENKDTKDKNSAEETQSKDIDKEKDLKRPADDEPSESRGDHSDVKKLKFVKSSTDD